MRGKRLFPSGNPFRQIVPVLGVPVLGLAALAVVAGLLAPCGFSPLSAQDGESAASPVELEQLEITFEKPRTVIVYPGDQNRDAEVTEAGRIYWYMRYTLANKGSTDAKFYVTMRATSDKDRRYHDLALPEVEKKVERIERRKLHSKADLQAEGKGVDAYEDHPVGQSRECVAIFNPIDPEADKIVIEVRGLINDLKVDQLGGGMIRVHERVLKLTYERPGDEFYTSLDQFVFKSKTWETIPRDLKITEE